MKKHIVAFSIVGMLIMVITSSAYALLIESDLFAIDDNLITMDTITGLEWLDLSETRGRSFNEVIGGFGEYTTTYGFRAATREEVAQLYTNAGIVNLNAEFVVENVPGVALLHDLMGCTQCGSDTQSAHGFIGEFTDDGDVRSAAIDFAFFPFNELRARADISIIFGPPNEHNKDIGTYLVRRSEIEVEIDVRPHILNLKSKGKRVRCWIKLPEGHSPRDIIEESLELSIPSCPSCATIPAIRGFPLRRRYIAFFPRQELIAEIEGMALDLPTRLELNVGGELEDGTLFEGSDTIWVIKPGRK